MKYSSLVQASVQQLKEKLVLLTNIPAERQRLIFRGAVLQDSQGLISVREPLADLSSSLELAAAT